MRRLGGAALLCALLAGAAWAQERSRAFSWQDRDAPVRLEADRATFDREANLIHAEGDVRLEWEDAVATADEATVDLARRTIDVRGHVFVVDPEGTLRADRWTADLSGETGTVVNARLRSEGRRIVLEADRAERCSDTLYKMTGGSFTTCVCPDPEATPPWRIRAESAEATLGETAEAEDLTFEVFGVPVLKSPYAQAPAGRKRRSGFLRPVLSTSSRNGFGGSIPYYWAPDRRFDATFYLEGFAKRGPKPGLEVRYRPTQRIEGTAFYTVLYDLKEDRTRMGGRWSHRQTFPLDVRLKTELAMVSDDDFVQDFREWRDLRNSRFLDARAVLDRAWESVYAGAEVLHQRDLSRSQDAELPQTLPRLTLRRAATPLFGLPVWGSAETSFNQYARGRGFDQRRGDLAGQVEAPLALGPYLAIRPYAGARRTWNRDDASEETATRDLFETGVEVSTELVRAFGDADTPWMHHLRPVARYAYLDTIDEDPFRVLDGVDALGERHIAVAGVENSLWGVGPWDGEDGAPRELAEIDLLAGFDVREARTGEIAPEGGRSPWTNVLLTATLYPVPGLDVRGDLALDPERPGRRFRSFGASAAYRYEAWRVLASFRRGEPFPLDNLTRTDVTTPYVLSETIEKVPNQAAGRVEFPIWKDRLNGRVGARWIQRDGGSFEYEFGAEYTSECKCWSAEAEFSREERPSETSFRVSVNLLGL